MRLVRASAAASRIALASLAAALLVAGCHVPGTSAAGPVASGNGSITVAIVPGVDTAPLQIAVQDGLFRQRGLDVTVKNYPSVSAEIQALSAGRADIAAGDYTDFFEAEATRAASLRLIADAYDAASGSVAVLTLPNSGITTPEGLQNRLVGTPLADRGYPSNVPYNMVTMAAAEVLQSDGVSPSSVFWHQMPVQNMIAALRNQRVKAIVVTEPYIFQAEAQLGAVQVLDASSGVTAGLPLSGYFSLSKFASAQPSNIQAFQAALSQAQGEAGMRGPVQAVLPGLTGMNKQDAAMVTLGTYPTVLSAGQVQRVATLMYDSGMIGTQITVGQDGTLTS